MAEDEKPIEPFPKEYPQCPNCGSEVTVTSIILADMRKKGIASDQLQGWIQSGQVRMTPDKPALSIPVIMWSGDICYDCGTLYAKSVVVAKGMVQVKAPPGYTPPPIGRG